MPDAEVGWRRQPARGGEADDRRADQPHPGHTERQEQQGKALHVGPGQTVQPQTLGVVAVEEPVAQTPEDLERRRRGVGGPQGLRQRQDRQTVPAADGEGQHPPQLGGERQHRGPHHGAGRRTPPHPIVGARRHRSPQHRTEDHEEDRAAVHRTGHGDEEGEHRRPPPAPGRHGGGHGEHQPREHGIRQQQRRLSGQVAEQIRAEHVAQGPGQLGRPTRRHIGSHPPEQGQHPQPCDHQDRPVPEPLYHPVGQPQGLAQPEERTHREQVADVLVGDGPQPEVRIPEFGGTGDELPGIEVQVLLDVGVDGTGAGQEQRYVGDDDEDGLAPPGPEGRHLPRRSASSHRASRITAAVCSHRNRRARATAPAASRRR